MAVNYTDFYDAQTARLIAIGLRSSANNILTEVNAIQVAIDTAAATGALTITVTNSTVMTTGAVYYEVWSAPATYQDSAHQVAKEKMETVISYFTRLGYRIKRQRNGSLNQIDWVISY